MAADIVRNINSIDKMEMFRIYTDIIRTDTETSEDKIDSLVEAVDNCFGSGILWLFNKLGAEAFELFDKNEKEDDSRGMDRL